ncbi:DNA repair protein RecN [Candidatus Enterococcus ferrettii]|uniref:DNA repair protein RecN n=1 Tax=Candidatus Enterococcus ferrettii TaxID=2815324 RepID=A0ABV0EWN0_9ENTE|nr:DNA repair protein RecN [Enterococcus sp. 665A]MBO1338846.1 DNA repair protein RecN [Enterococcus sp. 665A]
MLQELTIKNFAIISSLHLTFTNGMTALTGETGAGKSIIIDAVSLLAGARSSTEYIRQGSDHCLLEGIFDLPNQVEFEELVEELGIDTEENILIVQRDMNISGKNICRINGRTVTLANLRKIGQYIVDIQGQNDHQELMNPDSHLRLLDSFGSKEFQKNKRTYQEAYRKYIDLVKRVNKYKQNEQSFAQRIDMLKFQQEEIGNAQLENGEEERLIEERDKLMNFQRIVDTLSYSYQGLSDDEAGALDTIGSVSQELQSIASLDEEYQTISENVSSAYYLLQDAASEIGRQLDALEMDEQRLELVNERLDLIHQLKRKYGDSVEIILDYYQTISQELLESDFSEGKLEQLENELLEKEERLLGEANGLHAERGKIAQKLEKAIQKELKQLYMENARFQVVFKTTGFQEEGLDQIEFYITTNPGEPLKPLVKVASGGEISRIMLALKTIFSKTQELTSIVFDEVDTGVSGRVAQAIADKIYQIGENSQVLCITHLPQVAAKADHQLYIKKEIINGRTITKVEELPEDKRTNEIARMLAGAEITDLTVRHAKELLAMAKQ